MAIRNFLAFLGTFASATHNGRNATKIQITN
jgi:hypothetical protein